MIHIEEYPATYQPKSVKMPARTIKKRFSDETIEKLLETAWWNWDRQTLVERFKDLLDMDLFVEKYCSRK